MFDVCHPLHVPITPADNHPALGLSYAAALAAGCCLNVSPVSKVNERPFTCTRPGDHDGPHQGASLPGEPGMFPYQLVTTDAVYVVARWDDNRDTDGRW